MADQVVNYKRGPGIETRDHRVTNPADDQGPVSRTSRKRFGPEKPFQKPWSLLCRELFMSTDFAFKESLHLCSVLNLRIFLVFQLRTFQIGFSGPKTFRVFRETGRWIGIEPGISDSEPDVLTTQPRCLRVLFLWTMTWRTQPTCSVRR